MALAEAWPAVVEVDEVALIEDEVDSTEEVVEVAEAVLPWAVAVEVEVVLASTSLTPLK